MTISSVVLVQLPFCIVHLNTLSPTERFIAFEKGSCSFSTTAFPDSTDHLPMAPSGKTASSLTLFSSEITSFPAKAGSGSFSLFTSTSSSLTGQIPLLTLHFNLVSPMETPLMITVGPETFKVPVPVKTVHVPVPVVGCCAVRVASGLHVTTSLPASALSGG